MASLWHSRRCHFAGLLVLALVAISSAPAVATPITVSFSGTMTSITDPTGVLNPAVAVGAPFTGSYTIEPVIGGSTSGAFGTFYLLLPAGLTTVSIAGAPYSGPISGVLIGNGADLPGTGVRDFWFTLVNYSSSFGLPSPVFATVGFLDSTLTRLSSESFFVNPDLAGWDQAEIQLGRFVAGPGGGPQGEILGIGTITSVVAIPEPATTLLAAGGLCALAASRRIARRRTTP